MEIWISSSFDDKFRFPINPEEVSSNKSGSFEDITLASGNEASIIAGVNLSEVSFSSYFPRENTYFTNMSEIQEPLFYVNKIKEWIQNKKVLLLQITHLNISMEVTIRSFDYSEVGGAVGDIEFSISFKQHKSVHYSKTVVTTPTNNSTPAAPIPPKTTVRETTNSKGSTLPATYTVVKGDCLWLIAKRYYGDGAKYTKIYNQNKAVIGKNPNLIYPGQKLVIPK